MIKKGMTLQQLLADNYFVSIDTDVYTLASQDTFVYSLIALTRFR